MTTRASPKGADRDRDNNSAGLSASVDNLHPIQALQAQLQSCVGLGPERAKQAIQQLEPMFAQALPQGTCVVVDLKTCSYVLGATRTAALKLFIGKFDIDAKGWSFEVGAPLSVGAGLCPR